MVIQELVSRRETSNFKFWACLNYRISLLSQRTKAVKQTKTNHHNKAKQYTPPPKNITKLGKTKSSVGKKLALQMGGCDVPSLILRSHVLENKNRKQWYRRCPGRKRISLMLENSSHVQPLCLWQRQILLTISSRWKPREKSIIFLWLIKFVITKKLLLWFIFIVSYMYFYSTIYFWLNVIWCLCSIFQVCVIYITCTVITKIYIYAMILYRQKSQTFI